LEARRSLLRSGWAPYLLVAALLAAGYFSCSSRFHGEIVFAGFTFKPNVCIGGPSMTLYERHGSETYASIDVTPAVVKVSGPGTDLQLTPAVCKVFDVTIERHVLCPLPETSGEVRLDCPGVHGTITFTCRWSEEIHG
jgi:hypothetical protein